MDAPVLPPAERYINRELSQLEFHHRVLEQARDSLEGGADPSAITVEHTTRNQMRRFLVRHFLRSQARPAIRVIRLIDNLTDEQLRNLLNIGQARVDAIRSRVTSLKALKPSLDADDLRVENG